MRNSQERTWNMARNTEKMKNEKCTLQDLEYGEKTGKLKQGKLVQQNL